MTSFLAIRVRVFFSSSSFRGVGFLLGCLLRGRFWCLLRGVVVIVQIPFGFHADGRYLGTSCDARLTLRASTHTSLEISFVSVCQGKFLFVNQEQKQNGTKTNVQKKAHTVRDQSQQILVLFCLLEWTTADRARAGGTLVLF